MEIEEPRDLAYEDVKDYEKLTKDSVSPFHGKEYRDIFMLALSIGYSRSKPSPLKKRNPNVPLRAFTLQEKWLMRAVAISKEGNMEILFEPKKLYQLIEEYANAGIKLLVAEVFENIRSYDKILEAELKEAVEKIDKSTGKENEVG